MRPPVFVRLWGLGDKALEPWARAELDAFRDSGALTEVVFARSPERVADLLAGRLDAARTTLERGGTVYVSGNETMGVEVDAMLSGALGALRADAADDLRYIVST